MKRKHLFVIGLIAFMALPLLSGCRNEPESQINIKTEESDAAQGENEVVNLTFFASMDEHSNGGIYYREIIQQFNAEHDGIRVTFEGVPTADGYNEFLQSRMDKGEGDDIFIINADRVKEFYSKGYLYDMSDIPAYDLLNDAAKSQATIGDIAYCLPVGMNAYCMYVNLDVLDQYGLKAPQNLEEFKKCCETIKAGGGTPISLNRWYAMVVPAMANGLYKVYGAENTAEIIAGMNDGSIQIGTYMEEGFQVVEDFIRNGWYGDGYTTETVNAIRAGEQDIPDFANGETAFLFTTLNAYKVIDDINPDCSYVAQGVPYAEGTLILPAINLRLCVNAGGAHLDETLEFVEYFATHVRSVSQKNNFEYLPSFVDEVYVCPEVLKGTYDTYSNSIQIPIEDMNLEFTYWDSIRIYCINMFDGATAADAAENYNALQREKIGNQ